jgi:hypothetical protein
MRGHCTTPYIVPCPNGNGTILLLQSAQHRFCQPLHATQDILYVAWEWGLPCKRRQADDSCYVVLTWWDERRPTHR